MGPGLGPSPRALGRLICLAAERTQCQASSLTLIGEVQLMVSRTAMGLMAGARGGF
jgi:hypothetical protein